MKTLTEWTDDQDAALHQYEESIAEHRDGFEQVFDALFAIREERLYLKNHKTFADYCRAKWKFSPQWVNQMLAGEQAVRQLGDGNHSFQTLPAQDVEVIAASSGKAKAELASVPPEKRAETASRALGKSKGKPPTKDQVRAAADEVTHRRKKPVTPKLTTGTGDVPSIPQKPPTGGLSRTPSHPVLIAMTNWYQARTEMAAAYNSIMPDKWTYEELLKVAGEYLKS